jgi:hypothetical protein
LYEWNSLKFLILPEETASFSNENPPTISQNVPDYRRGWAVCYCLCPKPFFIYYYKYCGNSGYGLMYLNVFQNQTVTILERFVLGMSFVAIMAFTWVGLFHTSLPFNPMIAVGGAVLGTVVSYFILIIGTVARKYKMGRN